MSNRNPNLVPTLVVNKNGVSTTVYRKSVSEDSAAKPMPSPSIIKQYRDKETIAIRAADRIRKLTFRSNVAENEYGDLDDELMQYERETLEKMDEFVSTDSPSRRMVGELLIAENLDETLLIDLMEFFPELESESDDRDKLLAAVDSLHTYACRNIIEADNGLMATRGVRPIFQFADADDEVKRQCVALMRTTMTLHRLASTSDLEEAPLFRELSDTTRIPMHFIRDDRISKLAVTHADDIDPVLDAINGGAYRYEQIEAVLRGESASLSSGIL